MDLHYSKEVREALATRKPVVAMESTLITHGLPYPHNMDVAYQMETAVREEDAVPATVAIIQGNIHVGLESEQLEYIATRPSGTVARCSRRNLPLVMAQKRDGATTVAGTMIVARLAGIEMFATGGIGGVHRGHPFDVSPDLMELGRTPVTVVHAGPKPFLDLLATKEVLETQGILTMGYKTDDFAPFFQQHSGLHVDVQLSSAEEVANIICKRRVLRLQSGMLLHVPLPNSDRYDRESFDQAIADAVAEADAKGIQGASVTSWMIRQLGELFGPDSIKANIELLCQNARIAAQVANLL